MINLVDFTDSDHPFGNEQGRKTLQKLLDFVDSHPQHKIIDVSLENIVATDASFPRESVVSLAKQLKGERWFTLSHISSADLLDNWDYAAQAKKQCFVVWTDEGHKVIGPKLNEAARELLDYVIKHGPVTTAAVATALGLSVQNASTRLKKLMEDGLIFRKEEVAASGGIEFTYAAAKNSA